MKNVRVFFLSDNFQLLGVKCSIYLNKRVFVMFEPLKYDCILGSTKKSRGVFENMQNALIRKVS